jgi:glyoxylase-like metal-dependent hydrolase (beta-lactamase superfamily II)
LPNGWIRWPHICLGCGARDSYEEVKDEGRHSSGRSGVDHCYVVQGEGVIVIDGGAPGKANDFMKGIERVSIKPEEVQLIVLTHGHWDHIASAKEIKEATGAKIAMHQQEKDWLERPLRPPSPGPPGVTAWGRIPIGIVAMPLRGYVIRAQRQREA